MLDEKLLNIGEAVGKFVGAAANIIEDTAIDIGDKVDVFATDVAGKVDEKVKTMKEDPNNILDRTAAKADSFANSVKAAAEKAEEKILNK